MHGEKPERTHKREMMRKLVDAGGDVFARCGYRDATIQQICAEAGANVAAVNYYFDGKQNLYRAVWKHLYATVRLPLLEVWRNMADPCERLRAIIRMCVHQTFEAGDADRFRRIIHREIGDPTEMFDSLRERYLKPMLQLLVQSVAEATGTDPEDPVARHGAFSLHSQLMALHILRVKQDDRPIRHLMGSRDPGPDKVQALVEHLEVFALAGLNALRKRYKGGRT